MVRPVQAAESAENGKADGERSNIVLIAGGKDKGIAFEELGKEIVERVRTLVLTGMAADLIQKAVENARDCNYPDSELEVLRCDDFEDAVRTASKAAGEGDIVLLSPACTSFDRFKNFEERGNTFKDIVNRLD